MIKLQVSNIDKMSEEQIRKALIREIIEKQNLPHERRQDAKEGSTQIFTTASARRRPNKGRSQVHFHNNNNNGRKKRNRSEKEREREE